MLENAHLSEGVAVAKQRVTIADVAREAGTSTASVSYYLNDKREKLSEKTQNKIARVIKELDTFPMPRRKRSPANKPTSSPSSFWITPTNGRGSFSMAWSRSCSRGLSDGRLHEQL
ncbi:MAG: LacI family DNA-binding transcriptional regulator [Collinsella sp.]